MSRQETKGEFGDDEGHFRLSDFLKLSKAAQLIQLVMVLLLFSSLELTFL